MPLPNTIQPDLITIDEGIRLKKVAKHEYPTALPWYQNPRVMYYSEGVIDKIYDIDVINRMYDSLSRSGELYFIEVLADQWRAVGDVTLSEQNMPIIIGEDAYCGLGIARKVISALLSRAKEIGLERIKIPAIYKCNEISRGLFVSFGFVKVGENPSEEAYELILHQGENGR